MRKYFTNREEAIKARDERNKKHGACIYHCFKMPKGTRHHGEIAVCTEMEYLNTY